MMPPRRVRKGRADEKELPPTASTQLRHVWGRARKMQAAQPECWEVVPWKLPEPSCSPVS